MVNKNSGRDNNIKKKKQQVLSIKKAGEDISDGLRQPAEKHDNIELSTKKPNTVVGIGASAGGLEAFTKLLKNLPVDTGMAFVIVQHLDPNHKSILTDILLKTTKMPVSEVKDNTAVKPNQVYVIPPDNELAVVNGVLNLIPRKDKVRLHMPIDSFLESLAKDQGSKAIGVILSGTASDGTRGLQEIKAADGITFVQNPQSSKYSDMPCNAIATGDVDFVLPPEEIAVELASIARSRVFKDNDVKKDDLFSESAGELKKIFVLLQTASKINFADYKQLTVKRRILRRMVLHRIEKLSDYVDYLRQNPAEVGALHQDILINVTNFFREPESFETLKSLVFPAIVKNRTPDDAIRVWVPGCSTGEEAYSIAISLLEYLGEKAAGIPIKILATDVNETAIIKARQGIYPKSIKADVSPERLRSYFVEVDKGYQICKTVRDMCIFARQDIVNDPPFSRLDLISCRNVMIYLGSVLQKKMFTIFHYALKQNGFLILGTSESVGRFADLFGLLDKKYKVYFKKAVLTPMSYDFPAREYAATLADIVGESGQASLSAGSIAGNINDVQKATDRIVLSRYAPAGVIINSNLEIIQFRGRTGTYLEPASGTPSLNLLKMAREGLLLGLRAAVNQAKKENAPSRREGLHIISDGQSKHINVQVIPIDVSNQKGRYFLVMFEDVASQAMSVVKDDLCDAGGNEQVKQDEDQKIINLQHELTASKEYLQSVIEQYESVNEALRAANEEIQTSNEELQSMNEELETAKEELQSTNEELITLNDESQNRNQELSTINDDLQNLFRYINIPIVMLGQDLRIRRFNSEAEKVLNLIPADIGRPIGNINPNINIPIHDFERAALEVMETLNSMEQEVQDRWGRLYSMQIRPYRTVENRINGVVVIFVDISQIKNALSLSQEAREYAEAIVETVREPLLVLDEDLRLKSANKAFYQIFQVESVETENQLIFSLGNGQWNIPELRSLLENILSRNTVFNDFEVNHEFPHIGCRTMLVNARPIFSLKSQKKLILMAIEDITRR